MIPLELYYNRLNASLNDFIEAVEYVDVCKGAPASLKVTLCNADGRFTRGWACTKGDALGLQFGAATPEQLSISEVSVQIVPRLVTWTASAIPATTAAPSGRGNGSPPPKSGALVTDARSWQQPMRNARLSAVARTVCNECGLTLKYVAKSDPRVSYVGRCRETGYRLLTRLCRRYGLGLRATASDVQIISRPSVSGGAQEAIDLPLSKIEAFSNTTALAASKVQSARMDPRSGKVVRAASGDGDGAPISLVFDADDADSIYSQAVLDAMAAELTVVPDARFVAGSILQIPGYGLRQVTEMRYKRTGDGETMTLQTRGAGVQSF